MIIPEGTQLMEEFTPDAALQAAIKRLKWLDDLLDSPYVTIKESPTILGWYIDSIREVSDAFVKGLRN